MLVHRVPRQDISLEIVAEASFSPADLVDGRALRVRGSATPERDMKPQKERVAVQVVATYGGDGLEERQIAETLPREALDWVVLLGGEISGKRIFPGPGTAKTETAESVADCCESCHSGRTGAALKLSAFGNPLGCGIAFPTAYAGKEVWLDFGIRGDVMRRLPPAPDGYPAQPTRIDVTIAWTFYGVGLR